MLKAIVLTTTLVLSARAGAATPITTAELALTCGGTYKVLTSIPYFKDNTGTRAPNFAGTNETIEVIAVSGKDCKKIADSYGIEVKVSQKLDFHTSTIPDYFSAQAQAKERLGQTYPFEAGQQFLFVKDGTLPLFPVVHSEWVSMLLLTGTADTKELYGTPALSDLTDAQKALLFDKVMAHLEWGKVYSEVSWGDEWLDLALDLTPTTFDAQKEYAAEMLMFFKNATKNGGGFSTFAPAVKIGQKLNSLLNALGGTKWSDKLSVWKHHPLLFNDQIVSWARFENGVPVKAPLLTPEELEEFLGFAYEQVQALKVVSWLDGAFGMILNFKAAAGSIQTASRANGSLPPVYVLTPKAQDLVQKLLAFR